MQPSDFEPNSEFWNKLNSGPDWHPEEHPLRQMMRQEDFPPEAEFYAADNKHPVPSLLTYTGKQGPLPDPRTSPPAQEELLLEIDKEALDDLKTIREFNLSSMALGARAIKGEELPEGITPKDALMYADRAARNLARVIVRKREISIAAVKQAAALDERLAFVEDRAVAVVKQTLLALDQKFIKVGFGAWMPFRYPDQWLMFCGVLTRVLAANGLVHSGNPEAYRKILEETPPVPRSKGDLKTPKNWSTCYANRGSESIDELKHRLGFKLNMEDIDNPKPPKL